MPEENKPEENEINEKKIHVDDDWKSQVAAEKEALKHPPVAPGEDAPPVESAESLEMPPASLEMLVTTLATEAMVAMGQFPNPATQQASVNLEHGTYAIDMLAMLAEKTKGNLSPTEDSMLTDVLHQLRMMFISVKQAHS